MAIRNNPGTISSNLRFAYDIADTRNSYAGEPTTNQYTNPAFTSGLTGWTFASWDGGNYSYTTENIIGPFGNVVPALKITRTGTQTFADFHQGNGGKYTSGNSYTLSAYIKGSGTLVGNTQGGFSGGGANFTLTDQWQRVSYTVFSSTNSNYPYWDAARITPNVPMYFVFAQSEQKSYVTPYVNGTRSVTNSLFDISGYNVSLDMSNMSFTTAASPTFDGSNDYIPVAHANSPITNKSYEIVFKPTSIPASNTFRSIWQKSDNWNGDTGISMQFIYNNFTFSYGASWGGSVALAPIANYITVNNWYHIVGTVSGNGGTATMYINGSVAGTGTAGTPTTTAGLTIGLGNGGSFLGDMPIFRMYSETLSAAQVQQNYLAYKKRFGI